MNLFKRIWRSSVGKKYIMAVTGCCLVIFVIGHMLGNLQIFLGPEKINQYAYFLQHTPGILWPARIGLLALVALHVTAAIRLSLENRAARPVGYDQTVPLGSTYASRTMLMSGVIVGTFIIYHLLHFTVQVPALNLTGQSFCHLEDAQGRHDVFRMMILGFGQPMVSGFYLLGMLLLCLHLRHGIASVTQSLGFSTQGNRRIFDVLSWLVAAVIFLGNSSIPVAILCGYGKEALAL